MNAIKFAKIDYLTTKSQDKLMILFVIIASFLGFRDMNPVWTILYIAFGAMIVSTTPFFMSMSSSHGFYSLLPAKAASKAYGRALFGVGYSLFWIALGSICIRVIIFISHKEITHFLPGVFMVIAATLLGIGIQFLVLEFIQTKNPQVFSLIRMIIPFVLFFGGSNLGKMAEDGTTIEFLANIFWYTSEHFMLVSIYLLAAATVFMLIVAMLMAAHEERKER